MGAIEEIKSRIDIVELISQYVQLKKAGRVYKGLCPFHSEKTPSFVVYPDEGRYHCFGCGADGDIFTFLERKEGMSFPQALQMLAERAGVELPNRGESPEEKNKRDRLYGLMSAAAGWYRSQLLSSRGTAARTYLERRGVSGKTAEAFALGFAPDSWDACQKHLRSLDYTDEEMVEVGISISRETGGTYDRFRGRLMIPIRDVRGRVVGFGARIIGQGEPKYLNSPQSPIFDKGRLLFGLDMARRTIREENKAVVVEGYMDVISAFQRGVRNVVASMGTALTEHHIRQLKRLTRNIYLALDPDSAGVKATLRGLDVARSAVEEKVPVVRPGMVHFEHALDVDLYVLPLPNGQDPDDIFRDTPEKWEDALNNARPLVEFTIEMRLKGLDLSTAKGKSEAVRRVTPILKDVANDVERTHYIQSLSRTLNVDPRLLERQFWGDARRRRPKQKRRPEEEPAPDVGTSWVVTPTVALERHLIGLLLQDGERLGLLNELLTEALHEPLSGSDFGEEPHRMLFEGLSTGDIPEVLGPLRSEIISEVERSPEVRPDQLEKELLESALRLRIYRTREEIRSFQELLADAESQGGNATVEAYGEEIQRLSQSLGFLQNSLRSYNVVKPEPTSAV